MSGNKSDPRERRLKAVYDALDSGNNKKAVQEAEKVLRKDADCLCAKALRALAMLRSGRADEAAAAIAEVERAESNSACDEPVLQAMTFFYKESHRLDKIAAMYERAVGLLPKNEDLLTGLFMAYVRLLDHKKQQLTATRLHKLAPAKNPYYFWTVMSILMQAVDTKEEHANKLLLPLAARMADAYKDRMTAEAEVQLYLMVLEAQGQFEQCLAALDSPLAALLSAHSEESVRQLRAGYLERLGRTRDAAEARWDAVVREPNDWARWTKCLQAALDSGHEEPTQMLSRINSLAAEHPTQRGPRLARLDLLRRCPQVADAADAATLMAEYFRDFKERPAVAGDLLMFADLLAPDGGGDGVCSRLLELLRPHLPAVSLEESAKAAAAAATAAAAVGEEATVEDGSAVRRLVRDLTARLNFEQLARGLPEACKGDAEQTAAKVSELVGLYRACLLPNLRPTEIQPADEFLLLAVSHHYESWLLDPDRRESHLLDALYLLDEALLSSPSNHSVMLWMIRLFLALGAWTPAHNLFERLDVKQILLESMGHLLSRQVARCGQLSQGLVLLNGTAAFYKTNWRDMVEHLCTAYKIGNFRKVPEFVALSSRVTTSLESAFCSLELRVLSLLLSGPNIIEGVYEMGAPAAAEASDAFASLTDGRDFSLVRDFRFPGAPAPAVPPPPNPERRWLRYRSLQLRCISHLARMATEIASTGGLVKHADAAAALKAELAEFQRELGDLDGTEPAEFLVEPHPCRPYPTNLAAHAAAGAHALLAAALDCLTGLATTDEQQLRLPDDLLAIFDAQLEAAQAAAAAADPVRAQFGSLVQRLASLCESACMLSLVYELTLVALSGRLALPRKSRRPAESHCREARTRVADRLGRAVAFLEALETRVGRAWTDAVTDAPAPTDTAAGRSRAKVDELVCQSRCRSLAEMLNLLRVKARLTDPAKKAGE